jgi:hypothetical protein
VARARPVGLSNLDSPCAALASDALPMPELRDGLACSHVTNHKDDPRSKLKGSIPTLASGSVLSEWETKWVNKRSTGLRNQAGSQQKRFRSVLPPCKRTREYANPAGSTLNPKVAGSIPARPTRRSKSAAAGSRSMTTSSDFLVLPGKRR